MTELQFSKKAGINYGHLNKILRLEIPAGKATATKISNALGSVEPTVFMWMEPYFKAKIKKARKLIKNLT